MAADYWLLASCLQKAIRRGDLESARRAGHQLYRSDERRLWRRLLIIALEDIGVGDVAVAVELVALSTKPRWREEFGGDHAVLDYLLAASCGAIKERSGDHLSSLLSTENPQKYLLVPADASRSALLVAVASSKLPAVTRFDAAVRAAELVSTPKRPPNASLAGLDALYGTYRELGCPLLLIEACKTYLTWSRDILPLVIPLVWTLWREGGAEGEAIPAKRLTTYFEDGMPDYAFDPLHTRPGKQAVQKWVHEHPPLPWTPGQVASALWNYEAAACDRRLSWDEGERLRKAANRVDLLKAAVPTDECDKLTDWVRREYPRLSEIRREAWCKIRRRSYWTETGLERANPPLPVPGEPRDG